MIFLRPTAPARFRFWSLLGILLLLLVQHCPAGLTVYYLRHGETGQNVRREWENKPKDQWPAYVGNADTFTPKGWQQVAAVPEKLKAYTFDFIAVSPLWRTRQTIRPYLEQFHRQGEIWPEMEETTKCKMPLPDPLPAPSPKLFYGGPAIQLAGDEKNLFTLRGDAPTRCLVSKPNAQADAWAMAQRTLEQIRKRFGGTSMRILLVGHGNAGSNLLHLLTGDQSFSVTLRNTALWIAEEQPDGTFAVKMVNDTPVSGVTALHKK